MQFEDLQRQWQRLEEKLDRSLALEAELARRVVVEPARRRVNRLALWIAIDVACCVGVLLVGATFLAGEWRDWRFVLPASAVALSALALLVDSILQLDRVTALDWSGPVARIQVSLEQLRVAKIRQFKWIMLLSPLVGFCGLMAGGHGLLQWLSGGRANLLDQLDPWWFVGNFAFGVLFVPLGYLAARVLARRCHRNRWWQAVLDDISGKNLNSAALDVERWASLQREPASGGEANSA
jgi:hypothetical protein